MKKKIAFLSLDFTWIILIFNCLIKVNGKRAAEDGSIALLHRSIFVIGQRKNKC